MAVDGSPDGVTDLIIGGCVLHENMKKSGINRKILDEAIHSYGALNIKDVFYCYINGSGKIIVQKRGLESCTEIR